MQSPKEFWSITIYKVTAMERNLLFVAVFLYLILLSTNSFAQEMRKMCVPGVAQYNVTLAKQTEAGTYHRLGQVKSMEECKNKLCAQGKGDIAYLINTVCFSVKCYDVSSCDFAPLPIYMQDINSVLLEIQWLEVPLTTTASPFGINGPHTTAVSLPTVKTGPPVGPDGKVARSTEHRLLQDIIYTSKYDREVRPVLHHNDKLDVVFSLKLVQIVDVSEKEESLRINVWTTQQWKDPFLTWDPAEFDGIDIINVEPTMIWLPIVILYNNAGSGFSGGMEKYKTKVVIDSNGTVKWFSATQFLASCKLNIRYFPFDEQYCYMTFGSWTFSTKQLDMLTTQVTGDLSAYIPSGEWLIIDVPVKENKVQYPCCEDTFSDITYTIHIKRKVAYYVFNLIIPSFMIVVFTLVGFCLPPESGERIALNITVMLSMTVFLNIASNTLPATSDNIPLLGYFYLIIMIELCSAMVVTTIVLRFYYFGHVRMPENLRIIINEWIASMLFFFITSKPKDKGIYQCVAEQPAARTCRWLMQQNPVTSQSYVVQTEENHVNNHVQERVSLLDYAPITSTAKRNVQISKQPPPQRQSSLTKCRSEPAINSLGVATDSRTKTRHRRKSVSSKPRYNLNTIIQRKIVEGLDVLTNRVAEQSEKDECTLEWQFAATVLDRLCFVIFLITMSIPLLYFFFSSPEKQPPQM